MKSHRHEASPEVSRKTPRQFVAAQVQAEAGLRNPLHTHPRHKRDKSPAALKAYADAVVARGGACPRGFERHLSKAV